MCTRIRTTCWLARILGRTVPRVLLAALAGGGLLLSAAPAAHALTPKHPILFVHGIEGSGAQFESQAMRFESNGYAASWIDEVDYNSTRAASSLPVPRWRRPARSARSRRRALRSAGS